MHRRCTGQEPSQRSASCCLGIASAVGGQHVGVVVLVGTPVPADEHAWQTLGSPTTLSWPSEGCGTPHTRVLA